MENASKALIMAGAVLIALMVIALLVFFFNNIRDLQKTNLTSEEAQQAAEFNKQFDVYARDVYGSELLSLANKVVDYNKRESGNKGYTPIKLNVEIDNDITLDSTGKYFQKKQYTIGGEKNENPLDEEIKKINEILNKYSSREPKDGNLYKNSKTNWSRTISQLAKIRTGEWVSLLGLDKDKDKDEDKINEISTKITIYNQYKNLESEIKQKEFRYVIFDYDENTGRIIEMNYKLDKDK